MLEQFFDNDFKGFREDIMSELNSRIYSAIQEKKQEMAENFFTEATQPSKKKKKTESCTEDERREAAADFAMKNDFNEEVLDEANGIKGWKHAHSDIMKFRRQNANAANSVELVSLKKDGNESKMHDAKKTFRSEDEAIRHHKNVRELNPTRNVRHNLYVNGEFKGMLGESVEQIDEIVELYDTGEGGFRPLHKHKDLYNTLEAAKREVEYTRPRTQRDKEDHLARREHWSAKDRVDKIKKFKSVVDKGVKNGSIYWHEEAGEWKRRKKTNESVEQIDELKKETLGSYIKKALNDYGAERSTAGSLALGSEYRKEALKAARKRDKGIKTATDKLVKGDYQNEEVEQIDELKASTLGSYIKKAAKEMGDSYVVQQTQGLGKISGPTEEDKKIINAAQKHAFKRGKGSQKAEYKLATGNYQNESTLSEDTAEYLVDIKYPDGTSQKDFRIIGATEEDVKARLNKIFGGISGYSFDNFRLNH